MARSGSRLDPPLRRLLGFVCALVLLTNLAWAAGHAVAASASGALAEATSDTVPYLLLTLACLATLAGLLRARSSFETAAGRGSLPLTALHVGLDRGPDDRAGGD